jgi:hypothetical protein
MLPRRFYSVVGALLCLLLAVCGLLLGLSLFGSLIALALIALGFKGLTRLPPPADIVRRFSPWWRRRRWFHMAVTAWAVVVVSAVVVGVVAAESEPDSGGGFAPTNDVVAGIVISWGLLVFGAGFVLISLVAWLRHWLRLHRSPERDSRQRHFTSSL